MFYRLSEYLESDEIVLNDHNLKFQCEQSSKQNSPSLQSLSFPRKRETQTKQEDSNKIRISNDSLKTSTLACLSSNSFEKHFSQAGFFVKKTNSFYLVINLKKGGAFRFYDLNQVQKAFKNKGWVLKTNSNRLITNFWHSEKNKITISDNQITVKGQAFFVQQKYFNRLKFIIFRLFTFLAFNYKIAFLLKKAVRSLLILKNQKAECFFKRTIQFNKEKISIEDSIESVKSGDVFYGGDFIIRYVPQSNYFEMSDLYNKSAVFNIDKQLFICQNYNFKTNAIKTFKKESE